MRSLLAARRTHLPEEPFICRKKLFDIMRKKFLLNQIKQKQT
jgi:hypothetical protein